MLEKIAVHKPKKLLHRLLWLVSMIVVLAGAMITIMGIREMSSQARSSIQSRGRYSQNMNRTNTESDQRLAVITNSGSTNAPGSKLTIYKDGSGSILYEKGTWSFGHYSDKTFSAGSFNSSQLEAILSEIHDVKTVPDHGCLKSVSFGSTTTITYKGETSGDISCLSNEDKQIFQDLKVVVQSLYSRAVS